MDNSELLNNILKKPMELSENQKNAVISDNNHVRIVAGAGAGKTETLTRKIVYLLLYKNVDPSSIIAFTFTEKAAQNMKTRVYDRVKQLGGEEVCARLGEMFVGTIHSYCSRILEDHFGYGDYQVLDENQEMAFLMRIGWELGLGKSGNYSSNCEKFLDSLNVVYSELIPKSKLKKSNTDFLNMFEKYESILDSYKCLTFNRMIDLAIKNLNNNSKITENVSYLIVDEYQDINHAQEKLINLIGYGSQIFIVGDPRQTIYQWRGSDETCFEKFGNNHPDTDTIPIIKNRRSAKSIVTIANELSNNFEKQYDNLEPVRVETGQAYLGEFEDSQEEANWITNQIESLVKNNICTYKDIGILLRSVRTSGPKFIDSFRNKGIPFIIGGKVGLFRRDEIKAVSKLFAWLYDEGFWRENRYDENVIKGTDLLYSAIDDWNNCIPSLLPDDINSKLMDWKNSTLNSEYYNFTEVYYNLLKLLEYEKLDPDDKNHAVIMANLGRFSSLLSDYESANKLGGKKRNWNRDLKGLCWYMSTYATNAYEEQFGDDIHEIDAIQLMTVHQAKGLEWPIVFIPSMVAKRFPSSMTGRKKDLYVPRELYDADKYEGNVENERKLFYVALTRAKDALIVSHFNKINNSVNPSEFITNDLNQSKMTNVSGQDNLQLGSVSKSSEVEELQTFDTSEILAYKKCPYFYRFRHIWNYQPGLNEMIGYGNSLHFCLRYAAELVKNHGYHPSTAIATSVNNNFYLPFADKNLQEDAKSKAKHMLAKYVKRYGYDLYNIKEVESRIEFPFYRATIAGKVDVILHDQDNIEVQDYKTSDEVTTYDDAALQIQLYSIGLKMVDEPVTNGSISYLEKSKKDKVYVDDSSLQNAENKTEDYIKGIVNKDFTPYPSNFCENCDYNKICHKSK